MELPEQAAPGTIWKDSVWRPGGRARAGGNSRRGGRGKGEMGGESNEIFIASRALAAPQKWANGRLREHWTRGCSFVARKQEGRLESGTGLVT